MKVTVNNRNDPDYELLFDDLINEVFGFSFDTWLERKLWDEHYESYSIIKDNVMLANLCIFKTEMTVKEKHIRANQFGAVCTRECARGKGLSRLLIEHVLSVYSDTPAFLFANDSVRDFYPRFGFKQVQTYRPTEKVMTNNQVQKTKLCVDDPVLKDTIKNRAGNSTVMDCLNTYSTQMFHLIKDYADDIYLLPEKDTIVVAYQEDTRLFIADIISKKDISFEQIKADLPFSGIETVEFGFCPDWLKANPVWEPVDMNKVMFFIKGDWDLPETFRFPATSET